MVMRDKEECARSWKTEGRTRHSKRSSRVEVRRHETFPEHSKRARVLGWKVPAGEGGVRMAK